MSRSPTRLGVVLLSLLVAGTTLAGDGPTPPVPEPFNFRATQVDLAIDREGRHQPFRATVVSVRDDVVTVLTAAHLVKAGDVGRPIRMFVEGGEIWGLVHAVARNPAYSPPDRSDITRTPNVDPYPVGYSRRFAGGGYYNGLVDRDRPYRNRYPVYRSLHYGAILGADNAIARFRFMPRSGPNRGTADPAFLAIRPAPRLAASTYPAPSGGAVVARMVDAHGREHAVRAGNFENPRLLEWGHGFNPKFSGSGGGVFILHEGPDGRREALKGP